MTVAQVQAHFDEIGLLASSEIVFENDALRLGDVILEAQAMYLRAYDRMFPLSAILTARNHKGVLVVEFTSSEWIQVFAPFLEMAWRLQNECDVWFCFRGGPAEDSMSGAIEALEACLESEDLN